MFCSDRPSFHFSTYKIVMFAHLHDTFLLRSFSFLRPRSRLPPPCGTFFCELFYLQFYIELLHDLSRLLQFSLADKKVHSKFVRWKMEHFEVMNFCRYETESSRGFEFLWMTFFLCNFFRGGFGGVFAKILGWFVVVCGLVQKWTLTLVRMDGSANAKGHSRRARYITTEYMCQ